MKDGTTHLASLDTGAVVAAELHPADEGDTTTLCKTLAVAEAKPVDAAPTAEDPAECVAEAITHGRSGPGRQSLEDPGKCLRNLPTRASPKKHPSYDS